MNCKYGMPGDQIAGLGGPAVPVAFNKKGYFLT
jgi:hypothetical protein